MKDNRKFKGIWIPREIWLDPGLTIHEKVLLVEIDSLDNERGCFARNSHFCEFMGLKERRVQDLIKGLKDKGLLEISFTYKDGTKEIEKRILRVTKKCALFQAPLPFEDVVQETAPRGAENRGGVVQEIAPGGAGNCAVRNTSLENQEREKQLPANEGGQYQNDTGPEERAADAVAVDKIPYKEIQDLYNSICGEKLPKVLRMTDGRRKTIAARWKAEGKSLDTFKTVFENAAASPFLTGHGARGWVASFDWLLKPEKFARVLEGEYNKHGHKQTETKGDTHHDEQQQLQQQAAEFQELNRRSAQRMRERLERARALQAERERASTAGGVYEHHPQ